jgi:DNA-binding CsgD family transcriptional regulator
MLSFFSYIVFIFSAAFASAGVVLSTRLRARYKSDFFSTLLYYQVFIFTFGFYGIWGQVVLRTFLSAYVSPELLTRFTDISILLGLPFLIFAWLMLIKFSAEITGRKTNKWFVLWFLLINFLSIFGLGYFITSGTDIIPSDLVKYYYISLNFFYTILSSLTILFPGRHKPVIHKYESRIMAFCLIIIMTVQCLALAFYNTVPIVGLIFIFVFFGGNTFLPLYLNYGINLSLFMIEPLKDLSFDDFCRKYEVSPRESEIIREICNGLSNKEISDTLFISLQTVKDHTHRIYIKTNVRSRSQLMNLVKEVKGMNN